MNDRSPYPLSNLETHLGYWLRRISNHVSGTFARALQDRQFTVAEWVALRQLYDHSDIASAELATRLGMTRGAISKVLDKLEAKGLIERVTRPEDKRSQRLSLTLQGQRILPELAELADHNDQYFFSCLSTAEQEQLARLMRKISQVHQWNDVPID